MLTVTNYDQQTPTFQTKEKMLKVNPFLQKYGSKMVYASAGSAGLAGSAILASPEAISDPAAAKWFLGGGMGLVAVLMCKNKIKSFITNAKAAIQKLVSREEPAQTQAEARKNQPAVVESSLSIEAGDSIDTVKTQQKSKSAEVDSPIGRIKLTKQGCSDYVSVMKKYNEAKAFCDYWSTHNDKPAMLGQKFYATYLLEILQSNGDLAAHNNMVINSNTFGTLKLTAKGLKQYMEHMKLYAYAEGFLHYWSTHGNKPKMLAQKSDALSNIEILRAYGEIS